MNSMNRNRVSTCWDWVDPSVGKIVGVKEASSSPPRMIARPPAMIQIRLTDRPLELSLPRFMHDIRINTQ